MQIVVSMLRNEPCFFGKPEWRTISFESLYEREADSFVDEFLREFTALPALLINVRAFYRSLDEIAGYEVYLEALQFREALAPVMDYVEQKLQNGHDVVERPSLHGDTVISTAYTFSSKQIAHVCTFIWGVSIVINTIIARFLPEGMSASPSHDLQEQCVMARQHLYKSVEYSHQFRPFGMQYLQAPLIMAYRGATPEEKKWSMHQLWLIGELLADVELIYNAIALDHGSKMICGEPIVLPAALEGGDLDADLAHYSYMSRIKETWGQFIDDTVMYWEGKNA